MRAKPSARGSFPATSDTRQDGSVSPSKKENPHPGCNSATTSAIPVTQRPPLCKVSGKVEPGRKVFLSVDQEPGALLATFGDRTDNIKPGEAYRATGSYATQIIDSLLGIALGVVPDDMSGDIDAWRINAMIQAMSAFEPTNELEGMIAAQAVAMHHVTMDSLVRASRTDRVEFRQQHLSAANKSARTFAMLVETLNRHRGKVTTQRVVVENVNVHPGGQAVVGAVAGVGSKQSGAFQTHGQRETNENGRGESRTALPGPQQVGQAVPATCDEGQETLPSSRRRRRNRSSERQPKPPSARVLHRACDGDAPAASGRAEERSSTSLGAVHAS